MGHRHVTSPLAVAVALVLGLSACTANDETTPEVDASVLAGTPSESVQAAGAEPPPIVDDRTPLEVWWFGHYNIWDYDAMDAAMTENDALVAECMADKGWEYWPKDFAQQEASGDEPEPDMPVYGTLKYAEEFGYGVSIDDGFLAIMEAAEDEEEEWRANDPNFAYRDSLSDSARAQYELDLSGAPPPTTEQIASGEIPEPDAPFCLQTAADEYDAEAGPNVAEDAGFIALQAEIEIMTDAIEKDQRILEARAAWITCMSDAGHPHLVDSEAAQESIRREFWAYTDKGETPPPNVLAALQATERALAIADVGCLAEARVEQVTYDVTREFERAFVAENQAQMEETFARVDTKNEES